MPAQQEKSLPDSARLCQLITAVGRSQDRAAFAELFVYFAPRIKAYLMKRGAGATQAEELAQESMIMVWRRAATFDPAKSGAGTWIFTIARNKRIDALRRERRPDYDLEDPNLAPAPAMLPDRRVGLIQQSELLKLAVATLPEEQAELVRMAYFEDKAHGQIAAETNLPLGTVKSRLRLALGRLRRAMAGDRP